MAGPSEIILENCEYYDAQLACSSAALKGRPTQSQEDAKGQCELRPISFAHRKTDNLLSSGRGCYLGAPKRATMRLHSLRWEGVNRMHLNDFGVGIQGTGNFHFHSGILFG